MLLMIMKMIMLRVRKKRKSRDKRARKHPLKQRLVNLKAGGEALGSGKESCPPLPPIRRSPPFSWDLIITITIIKYYDYYYHSDYSDDNDYYHYYSGDKW